MHPVAVGADLRGDIAISNEVIEIPANGARRARHDVGRGALVMMVSLPFPQRARKDLKEGFAFGVRRSSRAAVVAMAGAYWRLSLGDGRVWRGREAWWTWGR